MSPIGCEIVTGARLHFGLYDTVKPFGGVGMMVSGPETRVSFACTDGANFSANGPGKERAWDVAKRFADHLRLDELPPVQVQIHSRPPAHSGLGSGTQLDMAVAEGLVTIMARQIDPKILQQQIACRGQRSAVGVYGYWQGGLIHDAGPLQSSSHGVESSEPLNTLECRVEFPDAWRIGLLRPTNANAVQIAGQVEQTRFQSLLRPTAQARQQLRALLVESLLPAIRVAAFEPFCRAVREYNFQAGLFFADVQGGPYNGQEISECIGQLVEAGFEGVGQTSWGPTIFVFCRNTEDVERLRNVMPQGWELSIVATGKNSGRTLTVAR